MGTSTSFRSPDTPKWRAAIRAYAQFPPERAAAEIFNAADEWRDALRGDALAYFVRAVVDAHAGIPQALSSSSETASVLLGAVDVARSAALSSAADASAVPIAERAFQRLLIQHLQADKPLAETSPAEAAMAWRNAAESPSTLVQRYLGEVLRQVASHAVARDAALVRREGEPTRSIRRRIDSIADAVAAASDHIEISGTSTSMLLRSWNRAVTALFEEGRDLPENR